MIALLPATAISQITAPLQHRWEVEPDFGDIWALTAPNRSPFIDVEGLLSDQDQVRLETARLITLNFDREGFKNQDRALDLLVQAIERGNESPLLVRGLLSAACALDHGANAASFWKSSQQDIVARRIVQRSLIRWKSPIALDYWRSVISEASSSVDDVTIAIEGLAAVGEPKDFEILLDLLGSNSALPMHRVSAAMAIGRKKKSGLDSLAQQYLESDIPERDLVAVHLLQNHADEASERILHALHETGSAPARLLAATALATNFPSSVKPHLAEWAMSEDLSLRHLAVQSISGRPSPECIALAMVLVKDRDARIRSDARRVLLQCATSGYSEEIQECASQLVFGTAWQGIEQGIILAVEMQYMPLCESFIGLLDHPQGEVHMHAAWGLMEIANNALILERIHQYAERMTNLLERGEVNLLTSETIRLSFLLEALGRQRYEPAYPMLLKYVPKNDFKMGNLARASAIWSIGQMRQTEDLPVLRQQLVERIKDLSPEKTENHLVRFACIIALGRMGYSDSEAVIEQYGGEPPNPLGYAAQWSLQRIRESGK
jgi:HEAT repeat protein